VGGRVFAIAWLCLGACGVGCTTLAGIDKDYVSEDAIDPGGSSIGGFVGASGSDGVGGEGGEIGEGGSGGSDGFGGEYGSGGEGAASGSGAAGAGGSAPLDAAGGSGGTSVADASGGSGSSSCGTGKKRCQGECVSTDDPNFGCSREGCTACPNPVPNSTLFCGDGICAAACKVGYVPREGQCVEASSVDAGGGAGGSSGGTAGSGGRGGSGGLGGIGGRPQCIASECPTCKFLATSCCTFFRTCGCSHADLFYCI